MKRALPLLFAHLSLTIAISAEPVVDKSFFNGTSLGGWKSTDIKYWSVKDGAIVGHAEEKVPHNVFIWGPSIVRDFHLSVEVKMTPDNRNAGIQFRSKVHGETEALGYQADIGKGVWGRLYHESGRGKLDWRDRGEAAVKPGEWNKVEILAVGDRIWTSINGKIAVSIREPAGEREGKIAFQVHSGLPFTIHYRNPVLTHDPPVTLAGLDEKALDAELLVIESPEKKEAAQR